MKRIITGHSPKGKAVFLSSDEPPRKVSLSAVPELEFTEMWGSDEVSTLEPCPADPTLSMCSFVPGPGGTRFRLVRFPPDQAVRQALSTGDPAAIMREFAQKFPGLGDKLEPQDPGMHRTETVDYGVVVSGEIWLELDDGAAVHMQQGDCVVQNGTRHAWRNRSDRPCVMAFVLVGARSD
jgi:hypothetical protein